MQKLTEQLKKYKAKGDGTTIAEHNEDLMGILNQLEIDKGVKKQMEKIILYHDIGKVVDSFQEGITNNFRDVRHEMLSASVKHLEEEEMLAILTHHKTLEDIIQRFDTFENEYLIELEEVEKKLGIEMENIIPKLYKYIRPKGKAVLKSKKGIQLKGLLNYCDHLGSSELTTLERGIDMQEVFKFKDYSSVQSQAKDEVGDILIVSPTGSGKTEASLYWASNIDKENKSRVFYILPYCASINAMYQRLNKRGLSVGMIHSKAAYFLHKEIEDTAMTKEQYQSYKYFTKHITISTTHQLFKAIFNCRFNEMLLTMFDGGTFIIDEIHSYDEKELALILNTLRYLKENYNIRICIMSASIPKVLQEKIQEELQIQKVLRQDQEELKRVKRHRVCYTERYIEEDLEDIKQALKEGKRVIVCVNTVRKSLEVFKGLQGVIKDEEMTLINSYFNLRDREKIEQELSTTRLLVGTQAIEVSLDIDFDEMYTEISPLDSQIQRWGRVNRKRVDKLKERKNIYIYKTDSKIYNKTTLERTEEVLKGIKEVDEVQLQKHLDYVYKDELKGYNYYKEIMEMVLEDVQLGKWESDVEYNTFTGVSVLPSELEGEYRELKEEKNYYEANSLLVNVPLWVLEQAKKDNALVQEEFSRGYGQTERRYVILYKYSSKLGLEVGEKESNFF